MDIHTIQHVLRNQWGKSELEKRQAREAAADLLDNHAALIEVLKKFMGWLDDGTIVRYITKDDQADWALATKKVKKKK